MNDALKARYPLPSNENHLRTAVEGICAEFGKITSLNILPADDDSGPQCLCLLRLDSPNAEVALKLKRQVFSYGDDIAFFASVAEPWIGRKI